MTRRPVDGLEIRDLRKSYASKVALDGLTLDVAPGEIVGFVGANGAGKSTAMRIAMGVLAPDSGQVRWRGQEVTFAVRRTFGYMPEQRGLYPKMRIDEQIAYFARLRGVDGAAATKSALALLERLGVEALPSAALQTLSLGNQQRVQLAAALVHDPQVLILDEPFSGLDPVGVDTMADVLTERAAQGVPVLFSSHQLELVERLCHRITIITSGRIAAQGTLEELRAAAGPAPLEVQLAGAPADWADSIAGVRPTAEPAHLESGAPGAQTYLIELADQSLDQQVLAAALRAGRVISFGWRREPLAQLYRDAVSDSASHPGGPIGGDPGGDPAADAQMAHA
jgi:ABC-2 type transport system ATP-binding protein